MIFHDKFWIFIMISHDISRLIMTNHHPIGRGIHIDRVQLANSVMKENIAFDNWFQIQKNKEKKRELQISEYYSMIFIFIFIFHVLPSVFLGSRLYVYCWNKDDWTQFSPPPTITMENTYKVCTVIPLQKHCYILDLKEYVQ